MQVNAKVYTLETDNAKLAVKALGAELTSWQPAKKQEWLHQSDHVWQGQAPLLFPFVGGLHEQSYIYKHEQYKMPKHGFVREREFTYEADKSYKHANEACLCLTYTSTKADFELYPFRFKLEAYFYLAGSKLKQALKIYNLEETPLYCAAGFHPAFKLPENLGQLNDFALAFPHKEQVQRLQLSYLSGLQLLLANLNMALKDNLWAWQVKDFEDQCWFFQTNGTEIELVHNKTKKAILHLSSNLPVLGVWQPYQPLTGSDFICLEPWSSSVGLEGQVCDLEKWQDRIKLEPKSTCTLEYIAQALI